MLYRGDCNHWPGNNIFLLAIRALLLSGNLAEIRARFLQGVVFSRPYLSSRYKDK